jgi:glycosyltransferase involved in cell wall biosynthesis
LVLVGRPTPYKEHLLDYALKNDLLDQVIFRQNITNQDLPAIYQSAEALIYPSVYEGFGIPILEALYSGVPVLTGTGSCLPETAGEAALFFNVNEPEELADHISKILSDRGLKEALIQKGKIQAEKFNGEKIAGRIMELYQMLL